MAWTPSRGWLSQSIRRPGTWLLAALFILITLLQYAAQIEHPSFLANLTANLGLTRYTVERILYLLPIIWAAFMFGWRGGAVVSLAALACMLPRDILTSPSPEDALIETSSVFVIGNLVSYSLASLRKERQRRADMERAQEELKLHLQVIREDERRLAALNQTASIVSQSLELSEVLNSAADCVLDVLGVEAVRIYVLDEEAGELTLAAARGLSDEYTRSVSRIRLGEGFNGRVAETGEPLRVEDASEGNRASTVAAKKENIRSQLVVPLVSKGKVVGTLSVAVRRYRDFHRDEVELVTAIGNQIGVAVENARLYRQEQLVSEQFKASERRYRELFENARDAIWLHDVEGNIITANRACVKLTGYALEDLCRLRAVELLSGDSLQIAQDAQERLLRGEDPGAPIEVRLVKNGGAEVIVRLASSLVFSNGQPVAIQHIARDVTRERQMQENMRLLLQQITRVQEEERKRIALELHDDTIQALVAHCQRIDDLACGVKGLPKQAKQRLEDLHEQANRIMQDVRRLSQDLRPAVLDNLGLVPALEWLASYVIKNSGISTTISVLGDKRRLSDEVEVVLFRITQEALRNVWKHSQATSAEVILEFSPDKTRLTIRDNGTGFDPPQTVGDLPRYGKLGLAGVEERVRLFSGVLTVTSAAGKGTTLTAELPL